MDVPCPGAGDYEALVPKDAERKPSITWILGRVETGGRGGVGTGGRGGRGVGIRSPQRQPGTLSLGVWNRRYLTSTAFPEGPSLTLLTLRVSIVGRSSGILERAAGMIPRSRGSLLGPALFSHYSVRRGGPNCESRRDSAT